MSRITGFFFFLEFSVFPVFQTDCSEFRRTGRNRNSYYSAVRFWRPFLPFPVSLCRRGASGASGAVTTGRRRLDVSRPLCLFNSLTVWTEHFLPFLDFLADLVEIRPCDSYRSGNREWLLCQFEEVVKTGRCAEDRLSLTSWRVPEIPGYQRCAICGGIRHSL